MGASERLSLSFTLSAAWRPEFPGPMALRHRLTAVLPLSRMKRFVLWLHCRGGCRAPLTASILKSLTPET